MPRPLILHHPACQLHITGNGHPESPERLEAVLSGLTAYEHQLARRAEEQDLLLCHPQAYIDLVKKEIAEKRPMLSTGDVMLSQGSWEAALRAVGAVLDGVDAAASGRRPFCAIRPPGHHAETHQGMGFCLFNNVAIGARYAQKKLGAKRILIADWDLHHGNGTEEIFLNDPSVFYFSTHQHPLYPGTGLVSTDHIVNRPISPGFDSRLKVLEAFDELPALMDVFKPDFVFISAGFDAHRLDPLGQLNLETKDFLTLTQQLITIATKHAQGRLVSCLEGGYHLGALSACAKIHVEGLSCFTS